MNERVTCRMCQKTYIPSLAFDFYPDGDDPAIGLCERCNFMREMSAPKSCDPHALPSADHAQRVCKPGSGEATCAFLVMGAGGFQCAKESVFEGTIRARLNNGAMNAKGDNCSGHPEFTPSV